MKKKYLNASLIVAGGGVSGVCAALAAARLGIKTILVHNRPVLGGNSSSEIRVWTRGATGAGNLFSEEMGILGILKMRNLYTNPKFNPIFWDEVLLDCVLKEKNITLLLNTNIENLEYQEDHIHTISGVQQASETEYVLAGDMYIDATGDGILGDLAGVPYQIGDEHYTGEKKQKGLLSSSILYYVRDTGETVPFIAPDYAYPIEYIEKLVNKGGRIISEKQTGSDCWWFEYGGLCNTISDSQEITLELKRLVLGIWNYIKNSGKYPNARTYTLEWIGNIPGKRESRRMITDYILSSTDILEEKEFKDGAFYGGWYMDFHPPGGLNSDDENCVQIPVNVYQIPLRCLYNQKVKNLLFAGRNIGTMQDAFSTTRVMDTCALSGQAAATLAGKCIRLKKEPARLTELEINDILNILQREDMFIPGKKEDGKKNLAESAAITASSRYKIKPDLSAESFSLSQGGFITIPIGKTESVSVRVKNLGEIATKSEICYYEESVPSCLKEGKKQKTEVLEIPAGENWIELHIPEKIKNTFCIISFEPNRLLELRLNKIANPGILCGNKKEARYFDPCIIYEDDELYDEKQLVNGYTRPYKTVNMWCSDEEGTPCILLEWDEAVNFQEIRLFLEPDLSKEIPSSCGTRWDDSHRFSSRQGMPPQLVRDLQVEVFADGKWSCIHKVRNNWQRMVILDSDEKCKAEKVKITVNRTWGDPRAQLYQINIYKNKITI